MRADLDRRMGALGRRGRRAVVAGVLQDGTQACAARFPPGERADAGSIFEIGSITKAFTGVLLADMVLAGEVRLEDPLSQHLPDRRPRWRGREPTLLELATHRSGLPNVPGPLGRRELPYAMGISSTDPWAGLTASDYDDLVAGESPRAAPGGRVRYSSMAVGLLGDALAARAGMGYDELLAQRVLWPLGLQATAVRVGPSHEAAVLVGHSPRGRPRPPLQDLMPAAGSLRSSAEDMLRFLSACLRPPADAPGPALTLARRPQASIGRGVHIGLCWFISTHERRPPVVWHNGGTWGFRSFAGFVPDAGRAAVVLSNTARGVDRLGFELLGR